MRTLSAKALGNVLTKLAQQSSKDDPVFGAELARATSPDRTGRRSSVSKGQSKPKSISNHHKTDAEGP